VHPVGVRSPLAAYIDDHLLGAFAAEELVRQCLSRGLERHRGPLEHFLGELREDRRELLAVQRQRALVEELRRDAVRHAFVPELHS
jgi:hypothetical protein